MDWDEPGLRAAARRAYEWGRFRRAGRVIWIVAPLVAIAAARAESVWVALGIGVLLFATVLGARWRGGLFGDAATTGLLAGVPAFAVPVLGGWVSGSCVGGCGCCSEWCMALCASGGLLSGIAIGAFAGSRPENRVAHLAVGLAIAAGTASVGCAAYGTLAIGAILAAATVMTGAVAALVPARA